MKIKQALLFAVSILCSVTARADCANEFVVLPLLDPNPYIMEVGELYLDDDAFGGGHLGHIMANEYNARIRLWYINFATHRNDYVRPTQQEANLAVCSTWYSVMQMYRPSDLYDSDSDSSGGARNSTGGERHLIVSEPDLSGLETAQNAFSRLEMPRDDLAQLRRFTSGSSVRGTTASLRQLGASNDKLIVEITNEANDVVEEYEIYIGDEDREDVFEEVLEQLEPGGYEVIYEDDEIEEIVVEVEPEEEEEKHPPKREPKSDRDEEPVEEELPEDEEEEEPKPAPAPPPVDYEFLRQLSMMGIVVYSLENGGKMGYPEIILPELPAPVLTPNTAPTYNPVPARVETPSTPVVDSKPSKKYKKDKKKSRKNRKSKKSRDYNGYRDYNNYNNYKGYSEYKEKKKFKKDKKIKKYRKRKTKSKKRRR